MPITSSEAAAVARRHGLSLNDAAGLMHLADSEADAEAIAEQFTSGEADSRRRL